MRNRSWRTYKYYVRNCHKAADNDNEVSLTGAGSVDFTEDVGHASLVASESSQMDRLGWVILGEGLALSFDAPATLLGQESQGPVTGGRKLSM